MPFKYATLRERLLANSQPFENDRFDKPCRIWKGMLGGSLGYGKITIRSLRRHKFGKRKGERIVKRVYAHRLSKALQLGVHISRLNKCCHLCDNPPCIEPTHLYSTTQRQNMRDMVERGRARNGYTADNSMQASSSGGRAVASLPAKEV